MLKVSGKAGEELKRILESDEHKNKRLVLYFMGAG